MRHPRIPLAGLWHLIQVVSSLLRLMGMKTFDFGLFSFLGVAFNIMKYAKFSLNVEYDQRKYDSVY
jgi:hypothetical protein